MEGVCTARPRGDLPVIEHAAWVGSDYRLGLGGQRVAIVGWSHFGDEGDEDVGTIGCVNRVISGEWKIRVFTQIRDYFGYNDHGSFWPRVMFFNYLPSLVGGPEERFGDGTPEQRCKAKERFKRLIRENAPAKVLVFTSRRGAFPPRDNPQSLGPDFPQFSQCKYDIGGHPAPTFFLRHPQGARRDVMRRAVKYVLDLPNPG
jgi:hypothetical protein